MSTENRALPGVGAVQVRSPKHLIREEAPQLNIRQRRCVESVRGALGSGSYDPVHVVCAHQRGAARPGQREGLRTAVHSGSGRGGARRAPGAARPLSWGPRAGAAVPRAGSPARCRRFTLQ